ncbi:MAG: cell wall hydrolase [Clostridia bacterium]|nr:cell wall hydrolase [Clostridia bacterium]
MKKLLCTAIICLAVLLGAVLASPSALAAYTPRVVITYNGKMLNEVDALLINTVTYVPFAEFCLALRDGTVSRDTASDTMIYWDDSVKVRVSVNKRYIESNGRPIPCQAGVISVNGKVCIPLLTLAYVFDLEAAWDPGFRYHLTDRRGDVAEKSYNEEDLYWLARIISAESKGEPMRGKIAVGNVVMNRVAHHDFPNTVKEVIFQKGQFTPVKNGALYDAPTAESVEAAKRCLDGETVTADALYFCNPAIATGTWMQRNCTYCMTIGNHAFYK